MIKYIRRIIIYCVAFITTIKCIDVVISNIFNYLLCYHLWQFQMHDAKDIESYSHIRGVPNVISTNRYGDT